MDNTPLVSIVIPTYNQRESFLRECIESAIAQTYNNIEIVISDNHSNNNAANVIGEYAAIDNRIRVVKPPTFLNMSESFLYVFTQAVGEYSCYVSSDDILMPFCVELLVEKLEKNHDAVFAHGQAMYFQKDNTSTVEWKYYQEKSGVYDLNKEAAGRLLGFTYVCFGGCLIRTKVLKEIITSLIDQNLVVESYIDILVTILLFKQGNLYYHNDVCVKVRMENDSRNTLQSVLIKDAVSIWHFWERDDNLSHRLLINSIDLNQYKSKQFTDFTKAAFYEYFNGLLSLESFKAAKGDLRSFKLKTPVLFSVLYEMIRRFPDLSTKLYTLIRKQNILKTNRI